MKRREHAVLLDEALDLYFLRYDVANFCGGEQYVLCGHVVGQQHPSQCLKRNANKLIKAAGEMPVVGMALEYMQHVVGKMKTFKTLWTNMDTFCLVVYFLKECLKKPRLCSCDFFWLKSVYI